MKHPNKDIFSDIPRQVSLAFLLEPLVSKPGATHRYKDLDKERRLEYFLLSAVNIYPSFEELIQKVGSSHFRQIYDIAYKAIKNSTLNRMGKPVNLGLVEVLFPIVLAQISSKKKGLAILDDITTTLEKTSPYDVIYLNKMRRLSWDKSSNPLKRNYSNIKVKNVEQYYKNHLINARKTRNQSSVVFCQEILGGFPVIRMLYKDINQRKGPYVKRLRESYIKIKKDTGYSAGLLSDYVAATIYILLSEDPALNLID